MKNIFKENKELKEKIKMKDIHINRLEEENTEDIERLRNYYDNITEQKIEWIKRDYNTKMERKKEVQQIARLYADKIANNLSQQYLDIDLSNDIDNYLRLLDYLKGE